MTRITKWVPALLVLATTPTRDAVAQFNVI